MLNRIGYIFLFFCFLSITGYLFMHFFKSGKPMSNTEEYLKAHGYAEGQVNEIRVGDALLRFPIGIKYSPETKKEIITGKADVVTGGFSHKINAEAPSHLDMVRVEFRPYVEGVFTLWENQLYKREWKSVVNKDDIGLVEYKEKIPKGWGEITYVGKLDETITIYSCTESGGQVSQCWNRFPYKNIAFIDFYFSGENLKNWKAINNEVIKFVDSIIVEE